MQLFFRTNAQKQTRTLLHESNSCSVFQSPSSTNHTQLKPSIPTESAIKFLVQILKTLCHIVTGYKS